MKTEQLPLTLARYQFVASGVYRDVRTEIIEATTQKEAHGLFWKMLTDAEKNATESCECIDVLPPLQTKAAVAKPDDACHLRAERDAYRARVTALEATLAVLVAAQDCSGLSRGARCARVKCAACDARALLEAAQ